MKRATHPSKDLAGKTPEEERQELLKKAAAVVAMSPMMKAAQTVRAFSKGLVGEVDPGSASKAMEAKIEQLTSNNSADLDNTLAAQAIALDAIFNDLAARAAVNLGAYPAATETYLRLALKAQAQCRCTLQAIAEVKNPRPIAVLQQTNIANGPQQVIGATAGRRMLPERGAENRTNKLLEAEHVERLDTGAARAPITPHTHLAAVGTLHGAKERRREGEER